MCCFKRAGTIGCPLEVFIGSFALIRRAECGRFPLKSHRMAVYSAKQSEDRDKKTSKLLQLDNRGKRY